MKVAICFLFLLVSCRTTTTPTPPTSQSVEEGGVSTPNSKPDPELVKLHEKLRNTPIVGFVALTPSARLYRSAEKAAAGEPNSEASVGGEWRRRRKDGTKARFARVIEDRGELLKIAQAYELGSTYLPGYEVESWVHRSSLYPVLSESIKVEHDDGTGFVLMPGMPVEISGKIRLVGVLHNLRVDIPTDKINLGFDPESSSTELAFGDNVVLGCTHPKRKETKGMMLAPPPFDEPDRVAPLADLQAEERERLEKERAAKSEPSEWHFTDYGQRQFPCGVRDDAEVKMNGDPLKANLEGDSCIDSAVVFRTRSSTFAQVDFPRAKIVVRVDEKSVGRSGSCGYASGPNRKKIEEWKSKSDATVFWEDGTIAGKVVSRQTFRVLPKDSGDLVCRQQTTMDEPLCFKTVELQKKTRHAY